MFRIKGDAGYLARTIMNPNFWKREHPFAKFYNIIRAFINLRNRDIGTKTLYLQAEISTACNLNCDFCIRKHLHNKDKSMNPDDFAEILAKFPYLILMDIQGEGEPFLNKHIFEFAAKAHAKGIYAFTCTNLNLPGALVKKMMASKFSEINISLEGLTKEEYEFYRSPQSSYDKFIENLENIDRHWSKESPQFGFWITLTARTTGKIEDFFKFAMKYRAIKRIRYRYLQDKENYSRHYPDTFSTEKMPARDEAGLSREIRALSRKYDTDAVLIEGKCRWPWGGLFVNIDKEYFPCCFFKTLEFNEGKRPLKEGENILERDGWFKLRDEFLSGGSLGACQNCCLLWKLKSVTGGIT